MDLSSSISPYTNLYILSHTLTNSHKHTYTHTNLHTYTHTYKHMHITRTQICIQIQIFGSLFVHPISSGNMLSPFSILICKDQTFGWACEKLGVRLSNPPHNQPRTQKGIFDRICLKKIIRNNMILQIMNNIKVVYLKNDTDDIFATDFSPKRINSEWVRD